MPDPMPAISLVAVPGRRRTTVELARQIERRGFAGIYVPSMFSNLSLCHALAWNTERIPFGTAISPIYAATPGEFAQTAAFLHEVSGGRFRFGIGVSHQPAHIRMGVVPGKPLADTRTFVEKFRSQENIGTLPPIIVAALRRKMVALAGEIGQGVVFANASLSHMRTSLEALPADKRADPDFLIGNMIPTCISDDLQAAMAVNRRTLTGYAFLPNYRNYWKEAGYMEEMLAIEQAILTDRRDDVPKFLTDRWLADNTLFGTAAQVRDRLAEWRDAGVTTPIVVPSSATGNQLKAITEVFDAFAA
jgi:alkanesulfonate monooxygenase SsuD/methylene tetrahydromethanopterin reductase-like flavin-dependent oxidoreductase (luciferase family)